MTGPDMTGLDKTRRDVTRQDQTRRDMTGLDKTRLINPNNGGKMNESKAVKEASPDTRLLYQYLSKMSIGDFVPYSQLSEEIGRNVQKEARHYLDSARSICEREHSKTFGVLINKGLKCLTDTEIVETTDWTIRHIRRTSRKSIKRLRCIRDFAALSNDDKIRHNANVSLIAFTTYATRASNIKKIRDKVQETKELLPYAKTFEAFK